jgi:hypothetical protein
MKRRDPREQQQPPQAAPYTVKLPGFLVEKEVGLGDVIKRVSYAIGIRPCGGCERRAAVLNRRIRISR